MEDVKKLKGEMLLCTHRTVAGMVTGMVGYGQPQKPSAAQLKGGAAAFNSTGKGKIKIIQ